MVNCPCAKHKAGHLPKLRPACLPSSLNLFLSLALVFSTYPPVSVCGTACFKSRYEPFLARWMVQNHLNLLRFCIVAQLNETADFPAIST